MSEIDSLLSEIQVVVRRALEKAVSLGRESGRADAAEEFKTRVIQVLSGEVIPMRSSTTYSIIGSPVAIIHRKQLPGTVKPTVLRLLKDSTRGMTTIEIVNHTKFKHNSVRGTLWTLTQEGMVAKNGKRWFATAKATGEKEGLPFEQDGEAADVSD